MSDDLATLTPDLASLGWGPGQDEWAKGVDPALVGGRVARVSRGFSLVFTGGDAVLAASASIRAQHDLAPATGDFVLLDSSDEDGYVIAAIADRTTRLARRAPGRLPQAQVLAANIDQVFVMHGLDREASLRRLERQLVVAWDSGAEPVVVLTKSDASADVAGDVQLVAAVAGDAPVVTVSASTGQGVDEIEARLPAGRTAVMLGLSGIGKSTLVNVLTDGVVQRTGDVRANDRKGRHTTVSRELIPIPGAGLLIDTPGIREIGLWQAYDGLNTAFSEVAAAVGACRFSDCAHEMEPGCAVREAMSEGSISARRLDHWHHLTAELALQEEQLEEHARRAESRDLADVERRRDDERPNKKKRGRASRKGRKKRG